jgi:glyoxylase-like metal-dependent hydrolase (beta-lactamase superfamily II)
MEHYICRTCGVEFAESDSEPASCLICDDERQYIGFDGQQWTTMDEMRAAGYRNEIREEEPGLIGISTTPRFAIGQRALLVQTNAGNILYDCITYLDDETIGAVNALGGIQGICLSHPHFYDSMVTWSHAFDGAPIYIPEADRQWVPRPDPAIEYWDGEPRELLDGVTLIQTGGHFDGSAVLHWRDGADGRGALFVGDSITVVPDRRYVSFMFSYPNLIPIDADEVRQIVASVDEYPYDRIYGGWWDRNVMSGAREAVQRSADRYIRRIGAS